MNDLIAKIIRLPHRPSALEREITARLASEPETTVIRLCENCGKRHTTSLQYCAFCGAELFEF